jgi:hypothetical protein
MIQYRFNDIEIDINLPNGVYIFDGAGAEGKTYLAECLRAMKCIIDEPDSISVITYEDFDITKLKQSISKSKIIMLDRADLYMSNEVVDIINSADKSKCLILIDLKNTCTKKKIAFRDIEIDLNKDTIKVTEIQ